MRKPTIYEIKELTEDSSPHFFTRSTLKFWGQTMKDFSVTRTEEAGKFHISAPMRKGGKTVGYTERVFNSKTNKLERV